MLIETIFEWDGFWSIVPVSNKNNVHCFVPIAYYFTNTSIKERLTGRFIITIKQASFFVSEIRRFFQKIEIVEFSNGIKKISNNETARNNPSWDEVINWYSFHIPNHICWNNRNLFFNLTVRILSVLFDKNCWFKRNSMLILFKGFFFIKLIGLSTRYESVHLLDNPRTRLSTSNLLLQKNRFESSLVNVSLHFGD